MSKEMEMDHS